MSSSNGRRAAALGTWTLALAIGASALAGASMAAAAQARVRAFDPTLLETGDLIRYRALTPEDFRADSPPVEVVDLHGELGAATCAFIATDPEMFIRASSRGSDARAGRVRAEIENLAFHAYMDRGCSWWNPAPLELPSAYILEHEQIHFALFEIAARRLNRRANRISEQLETVAPTQDEAIDRLRGRLDTELQTAMNEVLARSNDLDRQTSRGYHRDRQQRWADQVDEELRQLDEASGRQ